MEQTVRRPSLFRIIYIDYTAFLTAMFPLVVWVIYALLIYLKVIPGLGERDPLTSTDAPFFFGLAVVATLIGLPLLVWRIRTIQAVFARGVEVRAQITSASFYRDRGRVNYIYDYQGQTYESGNGVMKTRRTQYLEPGHEVILVVAPENPKKAFIRELYV